MSNPVEDDWMGELFRALPAAVDTLFEQLHCGNPAVEVKAARTILRFNQTMKERELHARLDELERVVTPFGRSR